MGTPVRVVAAFLASFGAAYVGYLFLTPSALAWYAGLTKPFLALPVNTLTVLWLIFYGAIATALAIAWTKEPRAEHIEGWVRFFFLQLLFTACYVMFFFGLQAVLVSFVDLLFLGFIVVALAMSATEIDRRTAYLLAAYFLWILYTAYLTVGIWLLN